MNFHINQVDCKLITTLESSAGNARQRLVYEV